MSDVQTFTNPGAIAPSIGGAVPIPTPTPGEDEATFVARCHRALATDYPRADQRHGICSRAYRSAHESVRLAEEVMSPAGAINGFARTDLPQIPDEEMAAFIAWLEQEGISFQEGKAMAATIRPTQAEIDSEKVNALRGKPTTGKLIVAQDGDLLDGHHRWAAAMADDPTQGLDVVHVDLPFPDLVAKAHTFPGAKRRDVGGAPVKAALDPPPAGMFGPDAQRAFLAEIDSRIARASESATRAAFREAAATPREPVVVNVTVPERTLNIDARTTVDAGAVRIEPGAVQVASPVTIAEGAVKVTAPPAQATAPKSMKITRGADGRPDGATIG